MASHPVKQTLAACLIGILISGTVLGYENEEPGEVMITTQPILMPLTDKAMNTETKMPIRGDSKHFVKEEFGAPFNMHKAKGKPPISRWDYDGFSVYFESDTVIHSVSK